MSLSQHEGLKRRLHDNSGIHLLSTERSSISIEIDHGRSQRQILHRPCRAALNFHSTIAWLRRRDSIPTRTSSSPVILLTQPEFGALPSADSQLPEIVLPVPANEFAPPPPPPANEEEAAVLRIQALYRGSRVRRSAIATKRCVVKVQATYRMWRDRRSYRRMQRAAERIQHSFRAWRELLRLESLEQVLLLERRRSAAALLIQSHARGLLVRRWRRRLEQEKEAAAQIQAFYRGLLARRRYLLVKSSAKRIQSAYKAWRESLRREMAATVIQKFVRRRKPLKEAARADVVTSEPPMVGAITEDWNTVEVEHLEQCLDTCLAVLNPPLPLEHSPGHTHAEPGHKQSLNEKRLQQVARVFLLQHHIALQQQRAENSPPFPPKRNDTQNHYRNFHTNANTSNNTITISKNTTTGDVVLDVQYLLEEVRKLGASSGSVLYMQNDDSVLLGPANQEIVDFKRMNVLLVAFVAVVIYTRSICQEVFVWAKQSTKK